MSRPRPILVLQHAGCEPPGAYEDELLARGLPFTRVLLDEGGELPDWQGYAAIVAMGGGMSVNDEAGYPWLVPEKRMIGEAVRVGMPYWGVCLGAQLLAASLGARVAPGARPELGVSAVELTDAARQDPVFSALPRSVRTLQWHGETYELPPGAVQLARSSEYEQQAFVLGRAYALQFHFEVDAELMREWMAIPEYVAELEQLDGPGAPQRLLDEIASIERESVSLARTLFARWLVDVVGAER
jgi:GMP synthase (glutamine-hydrolysing)